VKDRQQFEVETAIPSSIEEIVKSELYTDNANREHKVNPQPEDVNELLKKVYSHIEAEAIKKYKSNQLWAVKAWCYENVFKESVEACLDDETLLDEMVKPIGEWQHEDFNPLTHVRNQLENMGRKESYIRGIIGLASILVTKHGNKERFTQRELTSFVNYLKERYCKRDNAGVLVITSSYVTKVQQLKTFLDNLPEEDAEGHPIPKQRLPMAKVPDFPDKFYQPCFTDGEVESLICAAVLDEKPQTVLRLAIATIYGCRVGELAQLSTESINVDHGSPTIKILTEKKGQRKPQPIPEELAPLFSIPFNQRKQYQLQADLKRIAKKATVPMPQRSGVHAIRRAVVSALFQQETLKELEIQKFLRWSTERKYGVMPRYIKTPIEETDVKVMSRHPYVGFWVSMVPIMSHLAQYKGIVGFTKKR